MGLLVLVGAVVVFGLTAIGGYGLWLMVVDQPSHQQRLDWRRREAERQIDDINAAAQAAIIREALRRVQDRDDDARGRR